MKTLRHPRLFFDVNELESLRRKSTTGVRATALKQLVAVCDAFVDPTDPDYFDFRDRRKPMWRGRAGLFTVRFALECLSFAHAMTGDARYGRAAHDAVMTFIRESVADEKLARSEGKERTYPGWRREPGHDAGTYAFVLCLTYDLCYALFTEEDRRAFIGYARECIELAYREEMFGSNFRNEGNNRAARGFMGSLGMFRLTLSFVYIQRPTRMGVVNRAAFVAYLASISWMWRSNVPSSTAS